MLRNTSSDSDLHHSNIYNNCKISVPWEAMAGAGRQRFVSQSVEERGRLADERRRHGNSPSPSSPPINSTSIELYIEKQNIWTINYYSCVVLVLVLPEVSRALAVGAVDNCKRTILASLVRLLILLDIAFELINTDIN